MLLIVGGFAGLNFFDDVVSQCLVPNSIVSDKFNFIRAFAGSGEARNKIAHGRHSHSLRWGGGVQRVTVNWSRCRSSQSEKKTGSATSLSLGLIYTLYLDVGPLRVSCLPVL
jgi:hypothetical protein